MERWAHAVVGLKYGMERLDRSPSFAWALRAPCHSKERTGLIFVALGQVLERQVQRMLGWKGVAEGE